MTLQRASILYFRIQDFRNAVVAQETVLKQGDREYSIFLSSALQNSKKEHLMQSE